MRGILRGAEFGACGIHRRPARSGPGDRSGGSRTCSNSRGNRRPLARWRASVRAPVRVRLRTAPVGDPRYHRRFVLCSFVTRCRVPRSLATVTTIRPGAEVPPRDLGVDPAAVARIWEAAERVYQSGIHPALALCVRHRGRVLLDRAIGHAHGNGPEDARDAPKRLATPDTPFGLMS